MTPDAQIRGFKAGRFSFNVKGGRCEECRGAGVQTIEMNFLPDVYVRCKACGGHRYNRETLEVKYKGKNIDDVLNMTVNMAVEFFENIPNIYQKLRAIQEVGLGYLTLGQPCTTLSGGESQRIKLARSKLSKRDTGRTLYILDEPTTGLHFEDIRLLLEVLNKLVDRGNTVIVIEHNLDVVKVADHIIDIGPEGGAAGGEIIAAGTPHEVAQCEGNAARGQIPQKTGGCSVSVCPAGRSAREVSETRPEGGRPVDLANWPTPVTATVSGKRKVAHDPAFWHKILLS